MRTQNCHFERSEKSPNLKSGDLSASPRDDKFYFVIFFLILTLLSGCIRLTGNAGYWKQGAEDEAPKVRSAGFDSADFVPGSPPPGNIET